MNSHESAAPPSQMPHEGPTNIDRLATAATALSTQSPLQELADCFVPPPRQWAPYHPPTPIWCNSTRRARCTIPRTRLAKWRRFRLVCSTNAVMTCVRCVT